MERLKLYISESFNELKNNVTWPTWENLQQTSMIVLGATFFVALMIFVMDAISKQTLSLIYGI